MSRKTDLAREDRAGPLGFTDPPDLLIECDSYRGTLAALFAMVKEGKIDLLGVPLAPICESYFAYVMQSEGGDIDASATAMAALAYLLERKAWNLIPRPEDDEPEAPDDLMERAEPWVHEFQPAIQALKVLQLDRSQVFFRSSDGSPTYELPFELGEVTTQDLALALGRLLAKAKPDPAQAMARSRRSLADQMVVVLKTLSTEFRSLEDLLGEEFTRSEVVWWFLSLLELIRLGQACVRLEEGEVKFAGVAE
jgi:chromatin segregation and condensation protein Rec8/ScpA/Scc1 (kleisin family)